MMSDYKCNVLFQLPACATMLICLQVPKKSIIVSKRWDFSVWPYSFNFYSFIFWSSLLSTNTVWHSILCMRSVYWIQTEQFKIFWNYGRFFNIEHKIKKYFYYCVFVLTCKTLKCYCSAAVCMFFFHRCAKGQSRWFYVKYI